MSYEGNIYCAEYCTINGLYRCYNLSRMPPDLNDIKKTIDKQNILLEENNKMLHKLRRYQTATFFFTMLWYALLIGLPFALYFYVVGPYFQALGFSDGDYSNSLRELPGYRQFEAFFGQQSEGE